MFEYFGHEVNKLTRIQFGPLDLKGLNAGEGRVLTPHEVKTLRHLAENGKKQKYVFTNKIEIFFT